MGSSMTRDTTGSRGESSFIYSHGFIVVQRGVCTKWYVQLSEAFAYLSSILSLDLQRVGIVGSGSPRPGQGCCRDLRGNVGIYCMVRIGLK